MDTSWWPAVAAVVAVALLVLFAGGRAGLPGGPRRRTGPVRRRSRGRASCGAWWTAVRAWSSR
ncbi:hypothetical protein [Streptomyces avidinii]